MVSDFFVPLDSFYVPNAAPILFLRHIIQAKYGTPMSSSLSPVVADLGHPKFGK